MRLAFWLLLPLFLLNQGAQAKPATGRVIKVLPQFLDLQGRHALSPSLYERDAYQAQLRHRPAERSGLRFAVQWKVKNPSSAPLKLRLELRGATQAGAISEQFLETPVKPGHWWTQWTELKLTGDKYKAFGELTAWRATLWENDQLLGEQKSFLW